jgi:hypothetical protein
MRFGIADQPVHGSHDVCFGRLAHRIVLVVGQNHHVFSAISKLVVQETRHSRDIVDATLERVRLSDIIDPDEKGLSRARTVRVLKLVAGGSPVAETLGTLRQRARSGRGWPPGRRVFSSHLSNGSQEQGNQMHSL